MYNFVSHSNFSKKSVEPNTTVSLKKKLKQIY